MVYNMSNVTNANSTLEIITAVSSDLTGGIFIILMIVALFVIIFVNLSYYHVSSSLAVASYLTAIIGGFLWLAGLVPLKILIMLLILPIIGTFAMFFTKA